MDRLRDIEERLGMRVRSRAPMDLFRREEVLLELVWLIREVKRLRKELESERFLGL